MADYTKRAKFIKEERKARGWSQGHLAGVAGVDTRTIQRLEKSGSGSNETLMGVAQAFDMEIRELSSAGVDKVEVSSQRKVYQLPRLLNGKSVTQIFWGADLLQFEHDNIGDQRDLSLMMAIMEELKADFVRWHDGDLSLKMNVELGITEAINALENHGYYLFGTKRHIPSGGSEKTDSTTLCTIYMSHSKSPRIVKDKNKNMMVPAVLKEVVE